MDSNVILISHNGQQSHRIKNKFWIFLRYKKFQSEHPGGKIKKDEFKEIYRQNYPNSSKAQLYVEQVFKTIDTDNNNFIDFKEFMIATGNDNSCCLIL